MYPTSSRNRVNFRETFLGGTVDGLASIAIRTREMRYHTVFYTFCMRFRDKRASKTGSLDHGLSAKGHGQRAAIVTQSSRGYREWHFP